MTKATYNPYLPLSKTIVLTSDDVAAVLLHCARGRLPCAEHYTRDTMEYVVASVDIEPDGAKFVFRLQAKS